MFQAFLAYFTSFVTRNIGNVTCLFKRIEGDETTLVEVTQNIGWWTHYDSYTFDILNKDNYDRIYEFADYYYMFVKMYNHLAGFKYMSLVFTCYITIITSTLYLTASIYRIFYLLL